MVPALALGAPSVFPGHLNAKPKDYSFLSFLRQDNLLQVLVWVNVKG